MKEEENGEIPESIMEKLEKKAETEVEDETE